jgi:hypothetical protein
MGTIVMKMRTAALYERLYNILQEWPPEVRRGLGRSINTSRRLIHKKLVAEYRRRGWPGHPPFRKPAGYVTVKEAHKRHPHVPSSWFIAVAVSGKVPAVKDTLRWYLDLGKAIELRKSLFDDMRGVNNDAPDRITKKGIVYIKTTLVSNTNTERAFLTRERKKGNIAGFKMQYRRHHVYVDEARAFVLLREHRARCERDRCNDARKAEIVALLRENGEMHVEGIRQVLGIKCTNLINCLVKNGRILRIRAGWYKSS